jgi:hypothetical protein
MNPADQNRTCTEIAGLLVFYVCQEVDEQERASIEEHLALCEGCRGQFAEEQALLNAFAGVPQATDQMDAAGVLLAQCRSELSESLDELARPQVKEKVPAFAWLRGWMALHPVWGGALLVLFGLIVGVQFTEWFTGRNDASALDHAVNVRPGRRFTEDQLSKMAVSGINLTPSAASGKQNVHLQLSAEQPVELTGSLDDSDVRSVLTYVVQNGERFDPGVRLDCLDALKARAEDQQVRSALLAAARRDQNPAVRLKALEALRDSPEDLEVRATLVEALRHDSNPGVRVEAVNLLVQSLETANPEAFGPMASHETPALPSGNRGSLATPTSPADEPLEIVIRTLESLQRNDPSRYVRLRSAAALRQINARGEQ